MTDPKFAPLASQKYISLETFRKNGQGVKTPVWFVLHNDAVVQGLSEAPFMRDVTRWGVLTIGTGLGNACFTDRTTPTED